MMAGWMTDSDRREQLLCKATERNFCWCAAVCGYLGGLLFPELILDACDWNIHMNTHTHTHAHTWRHTLSLIAVCCPSSRLALWKGHLTKPLTGRCNTCVCSGLSDTKRHLWALPWQEKHCDIWLSDWPTGLQAGWQMKAGRHTNTIEAVMETRDGTRITSESKGGFTSSTRPSDSYAGDYVSIISLTVLTL